jgi:hypothetical protein
MLGIIHYGAVEEDQSQWENGDYAWLPGHLLSDMITSIDFRQRVYDRFGVYVGSGDFEPQKIKRLPFYLIGNPDEPPLVWLPELPFGGVIDLTPITPELPDFILKKISRDFTCDRRKPIFGIGRQYWCNACQIDLDPFRRTHD